MASEQEIASRFWRALRSDRVVMLGLSGVEDGHSQPMTAQVGTDEGPGLIWFFASRETEFVQQLAAGRRATMHFASKGHELFASVDGVLTPFNDRDMIERLWSPYVAAWFKGGKTDPTLQLLRFEPERLQAWLSNGGVMAGIKQLFGADPKRSAAGQTVDLFVAPRIS